MRVLIDESLPVQLAEKLSHLPVRTVQEQGWRGLRNGELLGAASKAGFTVVITADQSLKHQQNLQKYELGIVEVHAIRNRMDELLPLLGQLREASRATRG